MSANGVIVEPDENLPEEERTRCEVWSRISGYHRPVSQWNVGKKSEQKERKGYRVEGVKEPGQERNKS